MDDHNREFSDLFNSMGDAAFVHDLEGNFLDVNETAVNRLGYTREELFSMGPQKIDAPEFAEKVRSRIKEIKDQDHLTFESAHITKHGERIPVEIRSQIIQYKDQSAVLSIARDITERKRAEASEKRYRLLFENADDAVEDATIKMVNREFENLSGYSRKDIEGQMCWKDFVSNEHLGHLEKDIKTLLDDPESISKKHDFVFFDRWNNKKQVNMVSNAVPGENSVIASLLDVTERKQMEEDIKKSATSYPNRTRYVVS